MWMLMDSNHDHGRDLLKPPPDLAVGRKLRPLMPRPIGNHSYSTLSTPSCCCRNPKNLPWNHHISAAAPLVSTRWNPTPEQLQALEEMYRRGIRTPSAEQIQQIAAKLGKLGKIEGKNVFYWFQNHKARERQRKRRQLELLSAGKKMPLPHAKHTGLSTRYVDMEHRKTAPIPSNCSTSSADSASMHVAVISGKEGWPEMQPKNENCWQVDSSSSIKAITTSHQNTGQENTQSCENEEDQTLQLFPAGDRRRDISVNSLGAKITPIQFIEFLPIKN